MTYGAVAQEAGFFGWARRVGYALHACKDDDVPWWRVVNAHGQISTRDLRSVVLQRKLLQAEGIHLDRQGALDLAVYGVSSLPGMYRK